MRKIIISLTVAMATGSASALELSLAECRDMALASDENVKIAQNNVAAAALDREVAHTQYLPNFDANGTLVYRVPDSKMGDMMTMQMRGLYMAGINITQPIYAGGKITAANKLAKVGENISKQQLRATRMDIVADAEKSYWTYVAVLAKVDMTRSYLTMIDSIYTVTKSSVDLGMTPPQALLRVNTRRSEIVYRLHQAEAGADVCRMALCRAIGVDDNTPITPTEKLDATFDMPEARFDVDDRPETEILRQNIDVKNHQVTLTRGDYLPTVGMQLGYSFFGNLKMKGWSQDADGNPVPYSSTSNTNGFMGLLSVQIPIFHWGEGSKKVRRAKVEVDNARLQLDRNRRLMQLEVQQNYSNLVTGQDLLTTAKEGMREADENLRLMREQYEVGLMTLTDLLEAESQWQSSYSNLIEAHTQMRIYRVDYLRSIGTL